MTHEHQYHRSCTYNNTCTACICLRVVNLFHFVLSFLRLWTPLPSWRILEIFAVFSKFNSICNHLFVPNQCLRLLFFNLSIYSLGDWWRMFANVCCTFFFFNGCSTMKQIKISKIRSDRIWNWEKWNSVCHLKTANMFTQIDKHHHKKKKLTWLFFFSFSWSRSFYFASPFRTREHRTSNKHKTAPSAP